jgi:hypothetical protein
MNPRKITLKYLGWCPGVKSAAEFVPDRNIPDIYILFTAFSAILFVGLYQISLPTPQWEPKIITINGQRYYDSNFTEHFDYSKLTGKNVDFYEPLDHDEFVNSDTEIEVFFSSKEEIGDKLRELDAPNIVTGYTLWLVNGSWDEAYFRIYGFEPDYETLDSNVLGLSFGVSSDSFSQYHVIREPYRLMIKKMYKSGAGQSSPIWVLNIRMDLGPPYAGTLFRAKKR